MGRVLTTIVIWSAFAFMTVMALTMPTGAVANADGDTILSITAILAAAASISTTAIWVSGREERPSGRAQSFAKAKRRDRNRAERLIEKLDDDDIYDLEALLLAREDEARRHIRHS
ncbi:MAG: hypothetical protein GYB65_24255 [Chloroflexi bacterium]|nr:hypothetical protein [Chloroflexota bacterium]